jgi:predicted Zn-dependent protease
MLTQEQTQDIFSRIRRHSTADEVELLIGGGRNALTRFANNTIHQNVAEENYVISVRSVFAGRTARADTNGLDEESLRRVVEASETLARVQEPDSDLLPVASPVECGNVPGQDSKAPGRAFSETSDLGPQERAAGVAKIVDIAKRHKLTAAGIFSSSETMESVLNSRGMSTYHQQTSAEISVTMLAEDSSGWQKANSPDVRNLHPAALGEIAAAKAMNSSKPTELPPGKYTVILEPAAVLDLVGFMFWDWGGQAILDERSFLTGRVGTRLFGPNIDIWDDAYHPLQSGSPFDGEGVCRQRIQLVNQGRIERLVYARGTAKKVQQSADAAKVGPIEATGHGLPIPNELGEMPQNIVLSAADGSAPRSIGEMVGSTERGILVTRLWYIREVDPYEKILTGMTRDGTFLVENGKVQGGIRNFRFNQSLIQMLSSVLEMTAPVRASGEESFDMVVPGMKVSGFNFTEVTRF